MPKDEHGGPITSYWTEEGTHILTYDEMQKYMEEERRIAAGGKPDDKIDWSLMP